MRYYWLGSLLASLTGACSTASPERVQETAPIHIRWSYDPVTLDPLTVPNQNSSDAAFLLHMNLLQVDYQANAYAPALAERLPGVQLIGDSIMRLDYHLRPAATWDDGRPVLATDVDFTLKLMQCPGLPYEVARTQFSFIKQLLPDPTNPRHFTLVCRGQAQELINTSGDFPILPEEALDAQHTLRALPLAMLQSWPASQAPHASVVALAGRYQQANIARYPSHLPGCGPYRLAGWEHNRHLLFQRKAHWWADGLHPAPFVLQARAQLLDYIIVPDDAAAALALRRQELDVFPHMPANLFQRLQTSAAAHQELAFYTHPSYDLVSVGFNTRRALLNNKLTRQALGRLFDAAGLLTATQLGQGRLTVGLVPPDSPFYNDSLPVLAYAPERAIALLRQAGWQRQPNGGWYNSSIAQPLALTLRYRSDESTFATIALQFQAASAKLGIPVKILPLEASSLNTALRAGDFDVYIRTIKGNPFGFNFAPLLHTANIGTGNLTGFGRPDTDHLLEAISVEGNVLRKRQLLRRFQVLMRDEMPFVSLFYLANHLAASRQLRPVVTSGLKPGYAAGSLSWADSSATATTP
jgi:ABC-type transport system substrate-binding protein